jgi:hypothetical protein
MGASIKLVEFNGADETESDVVNLNFGGIDSPNLNPVANPIVVGGNSFIKYLKLRVTDMDVSNKIDNVKIWISDGVLKTGESIKTNLTTSDYTPATYSVPTNQAMSGNDMPLEEPSVQNIGIGGSLTGYFSDIGYSDYWLVQVQLGPSAPAGNADTKTFTIQYDEQ